MDLGPYEPRFTGGYRAADEVVAADVTAAFAYNDLVALGVLSRLTERGVKVPTDLGIVGFDDIPMASMTNPPLTTVAMPVNALSQAAAATMHATLDPRAPKAPSSSRRRAGDPTPHPRHHRAGVSPALPGGPPVLPGGPTP